MGSAREPWTVFPKDAPLAVRIYLWDTKQRETIQHRIIYLSPPKYELKIGRGSQSEQCLRPTEDNAWFTARVMSRDHAILRADAETKQITLEDTGSMHGTYINGVRLEQGKRVVIRDDTTVRFGAEIVRGELTYDPLDLQVHYVWPDDDPKTIPINELARSRNSFSVNYSEDEGEEDAEEDDDDIELMYESVRVVNSELDRQSRTFSVPDSDGDASDASVVEQEDTNSVPSSPVETTTPEIKNKAPAAAAIKIDEHVNNIVPGSTFQSALNVSDDEAEEENPGETVEHHEDDDQDFSEDDHESSDEDPEELEEGPDEHEEEAFNVIHEELCQYPGDSIQTSTNNRAPSPSDAALPKPWYAPNEVPAVPMMIPESRPNIGYQQHFAAESTIAPPSQPFSYYNGMNWLVNGDSNGNFNSSYPQTFCVPPAHRSAPWRYPFSNPRPTCDTAQVNTTTVPPENLPQAKSSKVSINDIIENVTSELPNDSTPRKRKADEISTSTPEEEVAVHETLVTDNTMVDEIVPESNEIQLESTIEAQECSAHHLEDVIPTSTDAQIECADSSAVCTPAVVAVSDDRSHKKIKIEHSPRSKIFLRYAAAAVVGAAVGAVGTVFGLAALPAEYFA